MSEIQLHRIVDDESAIAIVGMSGRFPGAANPRQLWKNLRAGVESISFFTREEVANEGVSQEILNHPEAVFAGGVLADYAHFDAPFFGYSPKQAEILDPQQRIFLECAWEALEDACCAGERKIERMGVFASVSASTHFLELAANPRLIEPLTMFQALIDNDKDFLATRVAYKMNLRGPSVVVQTGCSSSLVAVHMACQSLLMGESDACLAGGVSVKFLRKPAYIYKHGGVGSPDGRCRAFDAAAQGMVSGDGAGVVVLKRLADALEHRDPIYAIIRGSAINNDGNDKIGFTAPSVEGQAGAITEALAAAGVEPDTIGYVETHGTGTFLGDPIEIAALTKAFGRAPKQACPIGSLKTNIGHLDAAAGVAGLIKTALVLQHGEVPASLHFVKPNPQIDFANSPFYVNQRLQPMRVTAHPRRAGVSSFGVGGTNAHAVLEAAPKRKTAVTVGPFLLTFSAKSEEAVQAMAGRLADHLEDAGTEALGDVAYSLLAGRGLLPYRRAVVARDRESAIAQLRNVNGEVGGNEQANRPLMFVFPGQGAEFVGMTRELYASNAMYRRHLDECAVILRQHGFDLFASIFADTADDAAAAAMHRTDITQPALFAVEYALARLWMELGLVPEGMIGHSLGEYVAACLSGVMELQDALRIVVRRGQLVASLPAGRMVAVPRSRAELDPLPEGEISVAAINGSNMTVLSGPAAAIESASQALRERGVDTIPLRASHAFHSHMMAPILDEFAREFRGIKLHPPRVPYISNVTGDWITPEQAVNPDYWAAHLRQTVQFPAAGAPLLQDRPWVFLEVGPGKTLTRILSGGSTDVAAIASLPARQGRTDAEQIQTALGALWTAGVHLHAERLFAGEAPNAVSLPAYPFRRKQYLAAFPWRAMEQRPVDAVAVTQQEEPSKRSAKSRHSLIEAQLRVMEQQMEVLRQRRRGVRELALTPAQQWFFETSSGDVSDWGQSAVVELARPLNTAVVDAALQAAVAAHDSLRLEFRRGSEGWRQHLGDGPTGGFHAPLDIEAGRLIRYEILNNGGAPRLLVEAHHLAMDLHSWGVLLQDLETACLRQLEGLPASVVTPRTSFADWIGRLQNWVRSGDPQKELAHWRQVLEGRFESLAPGREGNTRSSSECVIVTAPRSGGAAGVASDYELCLAAAGQALVEWAKTERVLIHVESHGREQLDDELDLSRTTGWFTALFPVCCTQQRAGGSGMLASLRKQLNAVRYGGLSYGVLRYLSRRGASEMLGSCPHPEVSFNYLSRLGAYRGELFTSLSAAPARHSAGFRPHVLECRVTRLGNEWQFEWHYSRNLHEPRAIEELAAMTVHAARNLQSAANGLAHRTNTERIAPSLQ